MKGTVRSRAFVSMVMLALLLLGVPFAGAITVQGNASPTVLDDPLTMNAETILAPEQLAESDQLGWSVAIDGDTAVAGAMYDNNDAGAVYVYERVDHEWVRSARLVSPDPGAYESFGCSVAIEGDTIVVGEFRDKESGVNKGAVHVFTRSGTVWSHAAKLVANPRVTNGEFGCDVAISGGAIAIGSYGYDSYEGGAYVFRGGGSTWVQEDVLPAPTPEAYNTGESIDVDGDTLLVGVQKDDGVASDAGAVYVYTRSGTDWQMRTTLTASDGAVSDYFGCSVALDGQLALIGAKADDDLGNWSGAAYLFSGAGATWTQVEKILPSDGAAQDEFGYAVSLDG
ncbi:MAG TPA: FG-GAP repeat protein, partial [Coriobacteriia bacterium]|nr:FG-GAP repeat protein [Coriobacteriia bacterium]